jgi:hypothetical protein
MTIAATLRPRLYTLRDVKKNQDEYISRFEESCMSSEAVSARIVSTSLRQMHAFAVKHLSGPHPTRNGPLCPFVPRALKLDTLRFAVVRTATSTAPRTTVMRVLESAIDRFLDLEPREGRTADHKAILFAFPDVGADEASAVLDAAHDILKPKFVARGLMVGKFHPLSMSPGIDPDSGLLFNRSPVPLMAMRFMVANDVVFLSARAYDAETRVRLLRLFLERRGNIAEESPAEARWIERARAALENAIAEVEESGQSVRSLPTAPAKLGYRRS